MYESVFEISVHNVPDTLMPTCRCVHVNVNTRTVASVRERKENTYLEVGFDFNISHWDTVVP